MFLVADFLPLTDSRATTDNWRWLKKIEEGNKARYTASQSRMIGQKQKCKKEKKSISKRWGTDRRTDRNSKVYSRVSYIRSIEILFYPKRLPRSKTNCDKSSTKINAFKEWHIWAILTTDVSLIQYVHIQKKKFLRLAHPSVEQLRSKKCDLFGLYVQVT